MPSDSLYYELHGQAICPALPWEFLVTLYSIEAPRSLFAWTKKADPSLAFIHYLRAIGPRCACTLHGFRDTLNLGWLELFAHQVKILHYLSTFQFNCCMGGAKYVHGVEICAEECCPGYEQVDDNPPLLGPGKIVLRMT